MRQYGPAGLVLAVLLGLMLVLPASSAPSSGDGGPTVEEFNALEARVTTLEKAVAELQTPSGTPTPAPTDPPTTPTPTPPDPPTTPTPTPTDPPTAPTDPPTTTPPPAAFPTRDSVGPDVEPTRAYDGCYVDTSQNGTVVEGVVVDCAIEGIRVGGGVTNVTFRNSVLRGGIIYLGDDEDAVNRDPALIIEDSWVIQSLTDNWQDRAICCAHYVVKRSLIQGTRSALLAHNKVTLVGNYITTDGTDTHQSGLRALKNTVIRGNTIVCKPVEAGTAGSGCSGAAVFYRERVSGAKEPMFNMTIDGNYFKMGRTDAGELGGPYFATRFVDCAEWTDCTGVKMTNNVFDRGWGTDGGEFPFYADNVWADNYWADGVPALSGPVG